jgi:polyisoprenoid-binding protein YceI
MMRAPSGQGDVRALLRDGALAGDWVLDPRASSVRLRSRSLGLIVVSGVFGSVRGHGTVSGDGAVSGALTIAAASIDTRQARRDEHLRSADFFAADDHPDITFTLDRLRPAGAGGTVVDGSLTVRGTTRPLSFSATVSSHVDGAAPPPAGSEIWLDAEVRVNRAEFGLTWNMLGTMSMTSVVTVHAVFTR